MGSQTPSSDKSRSCWTPAMELYFIDLMLDHIHRGNRLGHTFSKQAWRDMLTAFNAKFRSWYDIDVLKSQYTSLWKQFSDIKTLLDQSGFSWSETHQMVVADDHAWDVYIKDYSDARYYKNKKLMHFNDLCLIYAYTSADGRYSRSSHDVEVDDNIEGITTGGAKEGQNPGFGNCSSTYWTLPMDHHFIDLLLDQVVRGNRIGHLFPTQAWIEMVSSLNAKFGTQYDQEVLKNRYNQLKQHHSDVNVCLNNNSFSWSGTEAMIKDCRDAESYKFKTASIYQKLCVIYGKGLTGRFRCMVDKVNPKEEDIGCNEHGNYSRTDWTPAMDRCLIDLMLNQVRKGHETNHISSERAWIDIFTLFNDRFGPGVDKFVLMDQFKSLRKLYNYMKNLLERSEFSWDESQRMVIASGDVWDAYIKEYLDGNSFRTKSKPSYNDLCAIFGNSTLETRDNRSVQDGSFNGDGWGFEASRNSGWTASMDRYFIDLMLEQMRRGSMIDQKFNEGAWSYMVGRFNSKFGTRHDEDVLKNHYKKIRKQFGVMKSLLDQNGFAWDETLQRIKAKDDRWESYIQEDPSARAYKNRTLPNYNDLFLIYGNANTNRKCNSSSLSIDFADDGLGVNIGQDDNLSSAGSDTPEICWAKPMKHQHSAMYNDEYLENYTNFSNALNMGRDGMFGGLQSPDSRDSELSHRRKKRRRSATPLTSTYSRKIKKTSEDELGDSGRSKTLEKIYGSIESIVDALQAIPGMDDELFLDACNLLEDEKKAKAFVKMDVKPRKKWLLRQLGR